MNFLKDLRAGGKNARSNRKGSVHTVNSDEDHEHADSGDPSAPESSTLQQTASKLHAFNRFEIKYFLDEKDVPRLREELSARMDTDPHSPHGGYPVTSLYYDTPQLTFYWEKIEGLKFRRKVHVRLYGSPDDVHR